MPARARQLHTVLGDPRVLQEHDGDPLHRVTVQGPGGRAVGAAVLERLYGPAAEVAVAVDDPRDPVLIAQVLDAVRDRARELGVTTLRFVVAPGQRPVAAAVGSLDAGSAVLVVRA